MPQGGVFEQEKWLYQLGFKMQQARQDDLAKTYLKSLGSVFFYPECR